jgi:hypothetical protein
VEGSSEHGNKRFGTIKCWKIVDWLHKWLPLEKGPAPWSQLDRPTQYKTPIPSRVPLRRP